MSIKGLSCRMFLIAVLLFALLSPAAAKEDFNVDRLPIGNPATKYDFCAVKLNQIFDTGANQSIAETLLVDQLKAYDVVMVGESHTSDEHHIVQYKVIKGLVESGVKVCLALEMFTPAQQSSLDDFIEGKYPADEFIDKAGWFDSWGYNIRYYQPIFDLARQQKIRIYGVNIDKKYARMLGRGQSLPEDEIESLPEIDTTDVEHRFLIKNFMEGIDATQPAMFRNLYQAQSLWDAAMADGAIRAKNENPEAIVVVLAGSGHVIYNLGIGRVIEKRSDYSVASVVAVDISKEQEESLMMKIKKSIKDKPKAGEMPGKMGKAEKAGKMPEKMVNAKGGMKSAKMMPSKKKPRRNEGC